MISVDHDFRKALELASEHARAGRRQQAEDACREILKAQPEAAEALGFAGLLAQTSGDHELAEVIASVIPHGEIERATLYNRLGDNLRKFNRLSEAVACYERALAANPDLAEAHDNLGVALQALGRFDEAVACHERALAANPGLANAHNNLGVALQALGRLDEAVACHERALAANPGLAEAHDNLGVALQALGRLDEAVACHERALAANPRLASACNNIASALTLRGDYGQAIQYYQRALSIDPKSAEAYYNFGNIAKTGGELDLAADLYRRAIEAKPDHGDAVAQLVYLSQQICDWHTLTQMAPKLDALTALALRRGERTPETPFGSLTRSADPVRNCEIARAWGRQISRQMSGIRSQFSFEQRRRGKVKIKIGYLSPDFQDHPTAHLMIDLFASHDRRYFEVIAYSSGVDDGSAYRARVRASCDAFIDLMPLSHVDAARRIYTDDVDVLVDLAGHTDGNRLEIFALRPAPIQASYLGFLSTTGIDTIDYIITDKEVSPESYERYYNEKFVYLPCCFLPGGHYSKLYNMKEVKRGDYGLIENEFVFCSFNSPFKIEPIVFDRWMSILRKVPSSVFWMFSSNDRTKENLRREAQARGIDIRRVVFADKVSYEENLARLSLADLSLDTLSYNGGLTTLNALWAGVPVVTLRGNHSASRMGSSILSAAGLSEIVASSLEEYESLAKHLAQNPGELRCLRNKLIYGHLTQPLYDLNRFTRDLERAYMEMWEIFLRNSKPRKIELAA